MEISQESPLTSLSISAQGWGGADATPVELHRKHLKTTRQTQLRRTDKIIKINGSKVRLNAEQSNRISGSFLFD